MLEAKPSILLISSADPYIGPGGIALNYVEALRIANYKVDFLTKYKVTDHPEIDYVLDKREGKLNNVCYKLLCKFGYLRPKEHELFYLKENQPPISIKKVLKAIKNDYDIIVVFFWQGLLTYRTIEAIYDNMKNPPKVVYICPDYSVMTGGCHFMGDCLNYKLGCGNCPMLGKYARPKDFTAWNVKDRKRINTKIRPVIFANTYMLDFMKVSPTMQTGAQLYNVSIILDLEKKYFPLDPELQREKICISKDVRFVLFFGCQNLNDKRKGMKYLFEALNILHKKLNEEERFSILALTAGRIEDNVRNMIPFRQKHMGFVKETELPILYSASDVFISPSVNDAGPSMVNQSIACGTPVVAFEMGTALDVINNKGTGFCVPLRDSAAMADALLKIFRQSEKDRLEMRKRCRKVALSQHSYKEFVKNFETALSI